MRSSVPWGDESEIPWNVMFLRVSGVIVKVLKSIGKLQIKSYRFLCIV